METIRELIERNFAAWRDRPYIFTPTESGEDVVTFGEMLEDVRGLAAALLDMGIKGACIGLYGVNCREWMTADLAVMGYVGVSVCIDRFRTGRDLESAVRLTNTRCLIYTPSQREEIERLPKNHGLTLISTEEFPRLIRRGLGEYVFPEKSFDECSKIVFSSGTTNTPKAAMLSQRNMLMGFDGLNRRTPMTAEDSCYIALPLHHTYAGLCNFLFSIRSGISIHLCGDVRNIAAELQRAKPTLLSVVPLMLERFYAAIPTDMRSKLDALAEAGEPFPPDAQRAIAAMFGGCVRHMYCGGVKLAPSLKRFYQSAGLDVLEAYALSETASIFSIQYSGDRDLYSVGTVFEEIEVKVAMPDATGVGELTVRGYNVFLGYCGDEAATRAAFDDEGFFYTGDLGRIGAQGQVYLSGRKKRVFILSNGENIYPEELEAKISEHSDISGARVTLHDGRLHAVLNMRTEVDVTEYMNAVNAALPRYERIESWTVERDCPERRIK